MDVGYEKKGMLKKNKVRRNGRKGEKGKEVGERRGTLPGRGEEEDYIKEK